MEDLAMNESLSRRSMFKVAGAVGATAAGLTLPRRAVAAPLAHAARPEVVGAGKAGKQGAGFYRFNVGTIEATVVSDGWFGFANPYPMFAPEASKDEFEKAVKASFLSPEMFTAEVNPLVLRAGKETIVVDAGMGAAGAGGTAGRFMDNFLAAGFKPEDVTGVILTHAHGDHINGLVDANNQPVFKNARVFVNKVEHEFWNGPAEMPKSRAAAADIKGMAANAAAKFAALKGRLDLVKPGEKVLGGLEIIDTAGHTPGHISVTVESGGEKLFITGDLAHNHVVMFHNPDWTVAFDTDPQMAAAARKRVFPSLVEGRTRVFAYHLPWPGLGRIAKHGNGYIWAFEPWAWGG